MADEGGKAGMLNVRTIFLFWKSENKFGELS
jgi:hypothetical protein